MGALRIVFAGSPAAAVPSLRALASGPHEIAAVVTRPPSPLGRRRILTPTPVAAEAESHGIPVIATTRIGEAEADLAAARPDLGVVVAYGGLIREPVLSLPRLGWVNLHFSLLPRWRGAAPVQHAIIAGDEETGAAVFQLVPELDAGPVFASIRRPIGRQETAGHLLESLAADGAELLARVVDDLAAGTATGAEQTGEVTLAPKLTIDDARIDWARPASEVQARIRGVTPEPGAHADLAGERVKILDAAIAHDTGRVEPGVVELRGRSVLVGTADDPIELVTVHPAGRRPMSAADWWRGRR